MNEYEPLFHAAIAELKDWRMNSDAAGFYDDAFYMKILDLLNLLRRADTLEEIQGLLVTLRRYISDTGPLRSDFLPSLHEVYRSMSGRKLSEG